MMKLVCVTTQIKHVDFSNSSARLAFIIPCQCQFLPKPKTDLLATDKSRNFAQSRPIIFICYYDMYD